MLSVMRIYDSDSIYVNSKCSSYFVKVRFLFRCEVVGKMHIVYSVCHQPGRIRRKTNLHDDYFQEILRTWMNEHLCFDKVSVKWNWDQS